MNTLALDIGGTKFTMALFAESRIVLRETRATNRAGGREWMLDQIIREAKNWHRKHVIHQCGIGFGGPVDFASQRTSLSMHVDGWQDFALSSYVEEQLQLPTKMENDANAAALGEAIFGAGKGYNSLFYMTLSTGIGGGIIEDGRLVRGVDSLAGEIGHITVRPNGPLCYCGAQGCLERLCGGIWLEQDYGSPPEELFQDQGFIARYCTDIAVGLKMVIMLLNPARIIIGGGISQVGEVLFAALRTELRRLVPVRFGSRIDLVPASLGNDSVLYGALAVAGRSHKTNDP